MLHQPTAKALYLIDKNRAFGGTLVRRDKLGTSYRVSLQRGSMKGKLQTSLYPVRSNQPPVSSLGYIEERRTAHPARVKAQLKGNSAGATLGCPVYGENRRTECTKRRQRTMRAVRDTARPEANAAPRTGNLGAGDDMFNGMEPKRSVDDAAGAPKG
jgi:hypothetical protein